MRLPDDARPPLDVYVNGVSLTEGTDYTVAGRRRCTSRSRSTPAAPEGLWQKLVMSTAGIGYYGRGDSIDVHFHRAGRQHRRRCPAKRSSRAAMRFEPLVDLPAVREPDALAFAFSGDLLLVRDGQPLTAAELDGLDPLPLGRLDGRLCLAYQLPDDYEAATGLELEHLRALWGRLPEPLWTLAGRALQTRRPGTATTRSAGAAARPPSTSRASARAAARAAA